jgi:hypothetical protein
MMNAKQTLGVALILIAIYDSLLLIETVRTNPPLLWFGEKRLQLKYHVVLQIVGIMIYLSAAYLLLKD